MTSDEYVVNELLETKGELNNLLSRNLELIKENEAFRELIKYLSPERLSTGTIYFRNDTVSEGDPGYDLLSKITPKGEE